VVFRDGVGDHEDLKRSSGERCDIEKDVVVSEFTKAPCCCLQMTTFAGVGGRVANEGRVQVSANGTWANGRRDDVATRSSVHFVLRR
jgi:hypothetical protein